MIELKTAKYGGVELLFTDLPTTGGNRLIKYLYPGSDKQSIERQGLIPRSFTMTIIIPDENYEQIKENTLRVLDDGVKKAFTHPTFGAIENVINGPWTLTERTSELGRAEITTTFEIDNAPGIPQQSGALASQVQEQGSATGDELEDDLGEGYDVTPEAPGNFADALDNLNDVSAAIASVADLADPLLENIASFRQSVSNFTGSINNLIQTPAALAGEISGMFEDVNNLFSAPETLLGAFTSLFSFGADDPVVLPTTAGRIQRIKNRELVRANMRTNALIYAYLSAVESEYSNTDDLDAVQASLEAQYLDIRNNQLISGATSEELDRLRVQAQQSFDIVRVNTRAIITIETPRIPLSVLVFKYYGSTELFDVIAEMNNVKQNAFVEGELRILTE
jgi:prophage DNA circulation protein